MSDAAWMRRALDLAREGEGLTRPNPPVGAVVLSNDGKPAGEGCHSMAGGPHAEIVALDAAGAGRACGGTLFVTLEPCSTHGRTPPCVDRVLAEGLARVVVGCRDPNPAHAGRGLRALRRAGIEVTTGVERAAAVALIEPFRTRMLEGRPFVTLKLGMTLDGRIADADGRSRWITGPAARARVQDLRRRVDAILVGSETVLRDDPRLLPRPARGRKPWRVFIDRRGRVPETAKLLSDRNRARTLRFAEDPETVLRTLAAEHDTMHLLCEGGGELGGELLRLGLVDELWLFYAGRLLGGGGTPAVGGDWPLAEAPALAIRGVERVGGDLLVVARPEARRLPAG